MTRALRAASNVVGGNIQIVKNSGGVSVTTTASTAGCSARRTARPRPAAATSPGGKEDQCSRL
jgi:hypothetical protein